ncbi:hypothetical protein GCM10007368_21990 [Isoptericola cucumis]|uniref:DUF3054 family protein n=1 Tax=Isoptericola cucumis TaxID=1776856 RepID=A0ABQ2B7H8_9MICO|nr:hypothetical protein GCM10007368_21990 [Isoptericola cucumis]
MTGSLDAVHQPATAPARTRRVWPAVVADVLSVLVFTVVGTINHATSGDLAHVALVGLPFLVALALGWLVVRAWRAPARPWPTGVAVWGTTVVVGLALRPLFVGGLAPSFAVVTAAFLAATLLGWRAVASLVARRAA